MISDHLCILFHDFKWFMVLQTKVQYLGDTIAEETMVFFVFSFQMHSDICW